MRRALLVFARLFMHFDTYPTRFVHRALLVVIRNVLVCLMISFTILVSVTGVLQ